jgi:hypothetical protein
MLEKTSGEQMDGLGDFSAVKRGKSGKFEE